MNSGNVSTDTSAQASAVGTKQTAAFASPSHAIPYAKHWLPWVGHSSEFAMDADATISRLQQRYGDCFTMQLNGKKITLVLNPHDFATVFKRTDEFSFDQVSMDFGHKLFGYSYRAVNQLVNEDASEIMHKQLRGSPLNPFTEALQFTMEQQLLAKSEHWQEQGLMDMVRRLIFVCSAEAMFGRGTFNEDLYKGFEKLDPFIPALAGGIPATLLPGCKKARAQMAASLKQQRANPSPFIQVRHQHFARQQIAIDESALMDVAILWAAQANTAAIAFWLLHELLQQAPVMQMVRKEVEELLSSVPSKRDSGLPIFSPDLYQRLPILDSCIDETLRLHSSVLTLRKATCHATIQLDDGREAQVKKGDFVGLYPRHTHLDPDLYNNPHQFQYDRFLNHSRRKFIKHGKPVKYPWLPFAGGKSVCPGRHLARNEFKLLTIMLLTWFDVELMEHQVPSYDNMRVGLGALPPKHDVKIRMRRRR